MGCTIQKSVTIHEPDKLTVSFVTIPSICDQATGEIEVLTSGGTGNKNYYWMHNRSIEGLIKSLRAGDYSVLVRDVNGCPVLATAMLEDKNGPVISSKNINHATCFGGGNTGGGKIELNVSGGSPPYAFQWIGQESDTSILLNARAGNYTVKITDNAGCITVDTSTILQPDTFDVSVSIKHTKCGAAQGVATAVVHGGSPPFNYTWSLSSLNSSQIIKLNSGDGTVTVTDRFGCKTSHSFEVLDKNSLTVTGVVVSNAICFPDSGGTAKVSVSGGKQPYTYSWYPQGGTGYIAQGLPPDDYKITVIDANGCRQRAKLKIESPEELKAYIYTLSPSSDTTANGAAYSIVYGGTAPYSYLWTNGETSKNIFNLNAGTDTFALYVTDSHGCRAMNTAFIPQVSNCHLGGHTTYHYCGPFNLNICPNCTTSIGGNIVTDFLATGNGTANDECAFEWASDFFASLDPAVPKKLIIPLGTYMVGAQDQPWIPGGNDVLFFNDIQNLTIEGEIDPLDPLHLPIIRFNNCMKYGAFDIPNNPDDRLLSCDEIPACDPPSPGNFYCRIMTPGTMLHFSNCQNVSISNLELDGNIDNIVVGGRYTEGIQIPNDGIFVNASQNVSIDNVNVHHFGRDGIVVYYNVCPADYLKEYHQPEGPLMNMLITNSKFNYNSRMGLTWGGGRGLNVYSCQFNYQGQGRFASKPYSGIDIEYEGGSNVGNMNGYFENCKFKYNKYAGMICDAGSGRRPNGSRNYNPRDYFSRNFDFYFCDFVGSDGGVTCHPNSRNFNFINSNFYGRTWKAFYSPIPGSTYNFDNTKFLSCIFSEEYTDPDILPLTKKSMSVGHDLDPGTVNIAAGCPNPNHSWCLEFSVAMRVLLQDCVIRTNFNLKTINVSADVFPPLYPALNTASWNIFENVLIENYGLNTCGCDDPSFRCDALTLNSVNYTLIRNFDSVQLDWNQIRNPGLWCWNINQCTPGALWYVHGDTPGISWKSDPQGTTYQLRHCSSSGCFLNNTPNTWGPLSEEYYNPVDPNPVNLYPDPVDCNVTTRFTTVSQPYHAICNPILPRKKNTAVNNPENKLTLFPNPATENIHINHATVGSEIRIYSILGEQVINWKVTEQDFEINIRNFKPGVYFIRTSDSKSYKFIKL
jgi:hypothetical protein